MRRINLLFLGGLVYMLDEITLKQFVKKSLKNGYTKEQVRSTLITGGYKRSLIDSLLGDGLSSQSQSITTGLNQPKQSFFSWLFKKDPEKEKRKQEEKERKEKEKRQKEEDRKKSIEERQRLKAQAAYDKKKAEEDKKKAILEEKQRKADEKLKSKQEAKGKKEAEAREKKEAEAKLKSPEKEDITPIPPVAGYTKAKKKINYPLIIVIMLSIILIAVIIYFSPKLIGIFGAIPFGGGESAFLSKANNCENAEITVNVEGSELSIRSDGCSLIKMFSSFSSKEPLELQDLFRGKYMTCPYTQGSLTKEDLSLTHNIDRCTGALKNSIIEVKNT